MFEECNNSAVQLVREAIVRGSVARREKLSRYDNVVPEVL
jgi:hypothetical protein